MGQAQQRVANPSDTGKETRIDHAKPALGAVSTHALRATDRPSGLLVRRLEKLRTA